MAIERSSRLLATIPSDRRASSQKEDTISSMKITLAQLNPKIGDFEGNFLKVRDAINRSVSDGADLIVFTELILSGYPPLDLLDRRDFIAASLGAAEKLIALSGESPKPAILFGTIQPTGQTAGKRLSNSALLVENGRILFQQNKTLLPTYDVFDEARYFIPAETIDVFKWKDEKLGITICEDAWNDPRLFPDRIYATNPVETLYKKGATLFINISASPYGFGKEPMRYRLFRNHALKTKKPFVFLNQVGANDELISDGRSLVFNGKGDLLINLPFFNESVQTIDLKNPPTPIRFEARDTIACLHDALVLGIRDYTVKCGFDKVVLGLSGGIDSSVVACLAVEALGHQNVTGLAMPSPYSSSSSLDDAEGLAKNLKITLKEIPISSAYAVYLDAMEVSASSGEVGLMEENLQARIRGNLIMAHSNRDGSLPLSSGNKSELSVGYCTLYGDMIGGLSVLGDVYKTDVYRLAHHINRHTEIIPLNCIEKVPSAELKPDQTDQDMLPEYELLDRILRLHLEQGMSAEEIIDRSCDREAVEWVFRALSKSEFKRKQAAPGLKVSAKAFGMGRRMPVAAAFV